MSVLQLLNGAGPDRLVNVPPEPDLPSVSGLKGWWDGIDPLAGGTPPSDNATATTWKDKSGEGKDLSVQGTGTVYRTSLTGLGYGGFEFTGSGGFYHDDITVTAPHTVFTLAKITSGTDGFILDSTGGGVFTYYGMRNGNWRLYSGGTVEAGAADYNWHLACWTVNGGSSTIHLDGYTADATNTLTNQDLTPSRGFKVAYGGSFAMPGAIATLAVYQGALGSTDRNIVLDYIADRYGLTIS